MQCLQVYIFIAQLLTGSHNIPHCSTCKQMGFECDPQLCFCIELAIMCPFHFFALYAQKQPIRDRPNFVLVFGSENDDFW